MEVKKFIIKLHLSGMIKTSKVRKICEWIQSKQTIPDFNEWFVLAEIANEKRGLLLEKFNSIELELAVDRNLYHSKAITIIDSEYPQCLRESYNPPNVLFYRGDISLISEDKKLLGIVGARKNSQYATLALDKLLPTVLAANIVTVSGLAQGVDSLVHIQTAANKGKTVAVIGTGLDVFYPSQNRALQQKIAHEGLVISEYPLGSMPRRYHFPARNRIIAGLVQTLLVVEAKHQSGSLITANLALQENRNVLAVPGPITSLLSDGTNELIKAGAKPIINAQDIIEEFRNT
ncbi:DNA-processing protein DprA [Liquorilactobacillus cacaonum]|uniref:DNA processing protein n=1 Tax=Liquorilactobacillus cacaonum DSM 21116 TaxID=1423729 RepID=A0A0R2CIB4_9LACO|nr:DNA-processing protein DprA [Liquorilactobacillus cacaonum]KRM90976.1 DNA processing protein [Liquorilactobacillus cacaonum DSM 21116]